MVSDPSSVTGVAGTTTPPPPRGRRPIGTVVSSVVDGARTLMRQEVELAKIEVKEAVAAKARGIALMVAAGVMALLAVIFLAIAGAAALDLVLPRWAANLIIAGVFVLIALILMLAARPALRASATPELTQQTLKEDAQWAKKQLAR